MPEIQGVIIFCDDVREETSGKATIVGTYGASCLFPPGETGIVELVGSFNGRIKGPERSVHLKITVDLLNHSASTDPYIYERDFADLSRQDHDEWTLRINTRIPLPFEPGAILTMSVEGHGFKTDASLRFGYLPDANSESEPATAKRPSRKAKKR